MCKVQLWMQLGKVFSCVLSCIQCTAVLKQNQLCLCFNAKKSYKLSLACVQNSVCIQFSWCKSGATIDASHCGIPGTTINTRVQRLQGLSAQSHIIYQKCWGFSDGVIMCRSVAEKLFNNTSR